MPWYVAISVTVFIQPPALEATNPAPIMVATENTANIIVSVIKTPFAPEKTVMSVKAMTARMMQVLYATPVTTDISVAIPWTQDKLYTSMINEPVNVARILIDFELNLFSKY